MSEENNIFGNFLKNEGLQNTLMNFVSQMSSHIINCDIFNKILDGNPNITDELISEQINLFKKSHPNSSDLINKYLQSYEEERSNKIIYQIRKFVKSGDCKKALDDPQVKKYLNEIFNSSEFQKYFSSQ